MDNVLIVLERLDGQHHLKFGEYFYSPDTHTLFIGIGDLGNTVPQPVGEITITENGSYDITMFSTATVDVKGFEPTGKLVITENGIYDIASKAFVEVIVPGVHPKGTLDITANGEYDVTEYAKANVNVKTKGLVDLQFIMTSGFVYNGDFNFDNFTNITIDFSE